MFWPLGWLRKNGGWCGANLGKVVGPNLVFGPIVVAAWVDSDNLSSPLKLGPPKHGVEKAFEAVKT